MCACCSFDVNKDKFIDFEELKRMMEKVGSPQTHLALKAMIREVDEDGDNRINFHEVRRYIPAHCSAVDNWGVFSAPDRSRAVPAVLVWNVRAIRFAFLKSRRDQSDGDDFALIKTCDETGRRAICLLFSRSKMQNGNS